MADFNRSRLNPLAEMPWRWTTAPVLNPDGSVLVPGVKSAPLDGAFILLDDATITFLRNKLTAAEKLEIDGWIDRRTEAQCATWHVPVWSGQSSAVYLRIPASEMATPSSPTSAKVIRYFDVLYA